MTDFQDQFGEVGAATAAPAVLPSALSFDDLCSYAPSRACIYLPCKTMWPNASVDDRLPPQPLLDASGNPVRNSKGKVVMMSASEWLAKHRSIEALTWDPGKPEFIHNCVVVDGGYIDKPGATTLNYHRPPRRLSLATLRKRRDGSSIGMRSTPMTPSTSSRGSLVGCSAPERRSTTRSCSAAHPRLARTRYLRR